MVDTLRVSVNELADVGDLRLRSSRFCDRRDTSKRDVAPRGIPRLGHATAVASISSTMSG
jgi:hypothetical protein